MKNVKPKRNCDHCGDEFLSNEMVKTYWEEIDLSIYHCKRCYEGNFMPMSEISKGGIFNEKK